MTTMTLEDAQQQLNEGLEKGTHCLCCTRYTKLYKRNLNAGMAAFLIRFVMRTQNLPPEKRWCHVTRELNEHKLLSIIGGDYSKMAHWGLIEQQPNTDESKSSSGIWRVTDTGIQFARGEITIPRTAHLLNNELFGFGPTLIDIHAALADKFDYRELMSA